MTEYASKGMGQSCAIPIALVERTRARLLVRHKDTSEEIQYEAIRLMMYGYKLELEAISHVPLHSLLPSPSSEINTS
jgi:hypothetical protein